MSSITSSKFCSNTVSLRSQVTTKGKEVRGGGTHLIKGGGGAQVKQEGVL